MTANDLVTELLGHGWSESVLPLFLHELKKMGEDAHRYYFIRDFAKDVSFGAIPRDREALTLFDRMLDEKQKRFS